MQLFEHQDASTVIMSPADDVARLLAHMQRSDRAAALDALNERLARESAAATKEYAQIVKHWPPAFRGLSPLSPSTDVLEACATAHAWAFKRLHSTGDKDTLQRRYASDLDAIADAFKCFRIGAKVRTEFFDAMQPGDVGAAAKLASKLLTTGVEKGGLQLEEAVVMAEGISQIQTAAERDAWRRDHLLALSATRGAVIVATTDEWVKAEQLARSLNNANNNVRRALETAIDLKCGIGLTGVDERAVRNTLERFGLTDFSEPWQRTPYSPGIEARLRNLAAAFQKRQRGDESLTFAMRTVSHFLFQYVAENRNRQVSRSPPAATSAERDAHVMTKLAEARSSALRDSHSVLEAAINGDRLARARLARRSGLLEEVAKQRMAAASTFRPETQVHIADVLDEPDDVARATIDTNVELPKLTTRAIADLWLQTVLLKHPDESRIARFLWERAPHAITRNRGFGGDSRVRMHKLFDVTGLVDRKHPWLHRSPKEDELGSSHGEKTEADDVLRNRTELDELLTGWLSALIHSSDEVEEVRARELWAVSPTSVTGGHRFDGVSRHIMFVSMHPHVQARFETLPNARVSMVFCARDTCEPCARARRRNRAPSLYNPRSSQIASSHGEISEGDDLEIREALRRALSELYETSPELRDLEETAFASWATLGMDAWALGVELDLPEEPILARIAWDHVDKFPERFGPGACGPRFDRATRVRVAAATGQDFEAVARLMRRPYLRGAPGPQDGAGAVAPAIDAHTGLVALETFEVQRNGAFNVTKDAQAGQTVTSIGPGVSYTWSTVLRVPVGGLYLDKFAAAMMHRELFCADKGSCPGLFARLMRFYRIPVTLTHPDMLEYDISTPTAIISDGAHGSHVSAVAYVNGKLVHFDTGAHGLYAFVSGGERIDHCVVADPAQVHCAFTAAYALLHGVHGGTFTLDESITWVSRCVGSLRIAAAVTRNPKFMITGFENDGSFRMQPAVIEGDEQPASEAAQAAADGPALTPGAAAAAPPTAPGADAGAQTLPTPQGGHAPDAPPADSPALVTTAPALAAPQPSIGQRLVKLTREAGLHICRLKLWHLANPLHRRAVRCYIAHALRRIGEEQLTDGAFAHYLAHAGVQDEKQTAAALAQFHEREPIADALAEGFSNAAFAARQAWYNQNGWANARPVVDPTVQALRELDHGRIMTMWAQVQLFPDDPPALPVEDFLIADEVFGYGPSDDARQHATLVDRDGKLRVHQGRIAWRRTSIGRDIARRWAGHLPDTFECRVVAPQTYQGRGMAYVAVSPLGTVADNKITTQTHTIKKDLLAGRMRVPPGAVRRVVEFVAKTTKAALTAVKPGICLEPPDYGMSEEGFVFKWVSESPAISDPAINTREPQPTWVQSLARAAVPSAGELGSLPVLLGWCAFLRRHSPAAYRIAIVLSLVAIVWRIVLRFRVRRWCHRVIVDCARAVEYKPNLATQHGQKDLMPNVLADVTHITWPDGCLDVTKRSSQTWKNQEVRPALAVNLGACGDADTFRQRLRSRIDETIRSHRTLQNADEPGQRLAAPVVATAVLQTQYQVAAYRPMLRGSDTLLSGYHHGLFETKTKEPDPAFSAVIVAPERDITAPEAVYTAIRLRRTDGSTALPAYRNASIGHNQKVVAAAMRVGQKMPPIDVDFVQACARFAREFNASIPPLDPSDAKNHEEWVKRYGGARAKQLYEAATASAIKQLTRCKSFIKRETTTKPGIPRAINAYNDHSKMYLGWLVSSIEKRLFALDHFVKGRPVAQIGEMLQRKFGDVPVVTTDYTAFECHHRAEYAEIFVEFVQHMTSAMDVPEHVAMITDLVRAVNIIDYGDVQCEIPQRLMSGALWTSLQNTYMNLVFAGTLTQLKLEELGSKLTAPQILDAFPMVFEGDDGMMVDIGQDLSIGEAGGLILKAERHASITTAGFCCQYVVPGHADIVCNPEKVLRKLYAIDGLYEKARESAKRSVLRAKALSYLSMYPRGPVVAAACHHVLRRTLNSRITTTVWRLIRPYGFNGSLDVSDAALREEIDALEAAAAATHAIPAPVRDACAACFGLDVDTQLEMERAFSVNTDAVRWDFDEWQRAEDDLVDEYLIGPTAVDTRAITTLPDGLRPKVAYGCTGFRSRLTATARHVDDANGHCFANGLRGNCLNVPERPRMSAADQEEQRHDVPFRVAGLSRPPEGQSRFGAQGYSEINNQVGSQAQVEEAGYKEGESKECKDAARKACGHSEQPGSQRASPPRDAARQRGQPRFQVRFVHARGPRDRTRIARAQGRHEANDLHGQPENPRRGDVHPISCEGRTRGRGEAARRSQPTRWLALRHLAVRQVVLGHEQLQHHGHPGELVPAQQPSHCARHAPRREYLQRRRGFLQRRPALQSRRGRDRLGLGDALPRRRVQGVTELCDERQRHAVPPRFRRCTIRRRPQHARSAHGEAERSRLERRPNLDRRRRALLDGTRRYGVLQLVQRQQHRRHERARSDFLRRRRHHDGQQQPTCRTEVLPHRLADDWCHAPAGPLVAGGAPTRGQQRAAPRVWRSHQSLPFARFPPLDERLEHERAPHRLNVRQRVDERHPSRLLHGRRRIRDVDRKRFALRRRHGSLQRPNGGRRLHPEPQSVCSHVCRPGRSLHHGHIDPRLFGDEQHHRRDRGLRRHGGARLIGGRVRRDGHPRVLRAATLGAIVAQVRRRQELPVHVRRSASWRCASWSAHSPARHHEDECAHRLEVLERPEEDRSRRGRHVGNVQGLDRVATPQRSQEAARREGHPHDDRDRWPRSHQRASGSLKD